MSDSKLPQPKALPTTDLTAEDQEAVVKYIAEGLPGAAAIDDVMISRVFSAYLEGKTYRNIAEIMRVPRTTIMFLSDRYGWYQRRREFQDELALHMQNRVMDAKIAGKDILIQVQQYFTKRIAKKMAKYYETENEDYALEANKKELDSLLKTLKTLSELTADGKDPRTGKPPLIGINVPEGATVSRNEDGSVEITAKDKDHGDVLAMYANHKRKEEEARAAKKSSDIDQETNPLKGPQGDKVDEND